MRFRFLVSLMTDYVLRFDASLTTNRCNSSHSQDMGLALTVEQFHELADRLKKAGVEFIIKPHLRFEGAPGEQYTMFFKDPSGKC